MLVGSGELSRELVLAFQRLGAVVIAVDRYADAPAHDAADEALVIKMTDPEELGAAIARVAPDYVVVDTNAVAIDALRAAADGGSTQVVPAVHATRLSLDREGMRRLAADDLGLPTAPFWFAGSVAELTAVAEHAGFPLVVKPVVGVPGQGMSVLLRPDDVEPAWQRAVDAGGPGAAQPGAGRDRRRDRLRGHAADREHRGAGRSGAALLRADRASPGRRRRAGVLAAAADERGRAGRGEVDGRPHRPGAGRTRACSAWSCWSAATRCTSPMSACGRTTAGW